MLHYTQWAMMNVGASLLVVVYPRVKRDSLRYQQQHPINGIAFGNTERERERQKEGEREGEQDVPIDVVGVCCCCVSHTLRSTQVKQIENLSPRHYYR